MWSLKRKIGNKVEDYALKYLKNKGLSLIERNYLTKYGELDLVMLDNNTLVFIEIRYRKKSDFGSAVETVNLKKQKKIINTAEYFLNEYEQYQHYDCRFDVLGVDNILKYKNVSWIKNAFEL
ncbi:Predicted endonuclease distantly related to archaeal Holliday junction resolvase [hydrothermal vent metagenome]|uniref:Predicted endonuclease distantly related to archaeal Holliday junction resolvase n=1 Tax=hydrothermal vent metagenome TaxID=652676 RepID=A0A1W1CUY4_9ZZZZ